MGGKSQGKERAVKVISVSFYASLTFSLSPSSPPLWLLVSGIRSCFSIQGSFFGYLGRLAFCPLF